MTKRELYLFIFLLFLFSVWLVLTKPVFLSEKPVVTEERSIPEINTLEQTIELAKTQTHAPEAIPTTRSFTESFTGNYELEQAGDPEESQSKHWWVNSGGALVFRNGTGSTLQGNLPPNSPLIDRYAFKKESTAGGYRPQNIFRLLSLETWGNYRGTLRFKVTDTDITTSKERNGSNGVLLFGRYIDQDNLYYAGIRVDGNLVIKKKVAGVYHTVALKKAFPGAYDKESNPNLIPKEQWFTLEVSYTTDSDGQVDIFLAIDVNDDGEYDVSLSAVDDSYTFAGPAYTEPGLLGIRTDFMDILFDYYSIAEL